MNPYSVIKTPYTVMLELAARHKLLRKRMKWSQAETAQRAGISLGSLKRFEQTGQISLESLLKLANLLDRLPDFDTVFYRDKALDEVERIFAKLERK